MSTRCTINFCYGKEVVAKIYRHCDGYPDGEHGVLADLEKFFANVSMQCSEDMYGTRFDDPSYLAAKFIVWQAGKNAQDRDTRPLAFGSLGVMKKNPGDIEYEYFVDCSGRDKPTVTYK